MRIRLFILLFSVFLTGCGNGITKGNNGLATDFQLGNMQLTSRNSEIINWSQYKGKTVFINFWATWCRPCIEEMPSIQRAMEIIKNENIEFLFATDEPREQVEKFRQRYNFPFQYVQTESYQSYGIMVLPTTFIFDPEGKLVFSEAGYRKWDNKNNIDLLKSITRQK
jgi:thiol-disulfide isomerase/thioredoxin